MVKIVIRHDKDQVKIRVRPPKRATVVNNLNRGSDRRREEDSDMRMKETVTSIRGWLGLWGVGGIFLGMWWIVLTPQDIFTTIFSSFYLCIGIGFLYSSIKFSEFVHTSTKLVQQLLYAVLGMSIVSLSLELFLGNYGMGFFSPIIGVMIVWYLLLNVRRSEEEHGLHEFEG